MALLHQMLYQSEDIAAISLGTYVASLVENLRMTYSLPQRSVRFESRVDDLNLPIEYGHPMRPDRQRAVVELDPACLPRWQVWHDSHQSGSRRGDAGDHCRG